MQTSLSPPSDGLLHCSIGIMAYNEAANIGRLLDALQRQRTRRARIDEIVVVASGCTDGTEDIVRQFAAQDGRIRLLTQPTRQGKASAVNLYLHHTASDIIVLQSADTLPLPGSIEALITPFADPRTGMVGGRPTPTNRRDTFMGFGIHLLWELHHLVSLERPKMGELIAFRNIFRQIPYDTAVDEASIEPLIIGQGMELRYAPEAVVLNKGPENLRDFIKQRRRIFAGHLYVRETLGYKVATLNHWRILRLFLKHVELDWRYFLWAPAFIALEVFVRALGAYDYSVRHRNPFNWAVAESTKDLPEIA